MRGPPPGKGVQNFYSSPLSVSSRQLVYVDIAKKRKEVDQRLIEAASIPIEEDEGSTEADEGVELEYIMCLLSTVVTQPSPW